MPTDIDSTLFADVADVLNIENPILVEKDYYAVQLIKFLSTIDFTPYHLVFSGGTCLAKAYQNTYRMSEDVDFKVINTATNKSISHARKQRKVIHEKINSLIESTNLFKVDDFYK